MASPIFVVLPDVEHVLANSAQRRETDGGDWVSGRYPGGHAAGKLANDSFVPNVERRPQNVRERLVGVAHDNDRRRRIYHPTEPRRERRPQCDGDRSGNVSGGDIANRPDVDHRGTNALQRLDLTHRESGYLRFGGDDFRTATVGFAEPREVRRVAAEAAGQFADERVDVRQSEQRVGGLLGADRGCEATAAWCRAKRPGTVRRPHRGRVRQRGEPLDRRVLRSCELDRAVLTKQVGPSGGPDDERAAGEDADRRRAVANQE